MLEIERLTDQNRAVVSMRETLEQDLGRILLGATRGVKDGTGRFVVSVGSDEVHVEISLKPLNPHVGPDDPLVLNLVKQLACPAEKVRNGRRLEPSSAVPTRTVQDERSIDDCQGRSETQIPHLD